MWTHNGEEKRKMKRAEEERNPILSPTKKERDTANATSASPSNDIYECLYYRHFILNGEILGT